MTIDENIVKDIRFLLKQIIDWSGEAPDSRSSAQRNF